MRYRPKDWKNPYTEENSEIAIIVESGPMPDEAYEAGADAMLEGLRGYGEAIGANLVEVPCELRVGGRKGYLVFIPDEAEEYEQATTVEFTADDIIN